MNLSRIDEELIFLFSHMGGGLIKIAVKYEDHYEYLQLDKSDICHLSDNKNIVMIELDRRQNKDYGRIE